MGFQYGNPLKNMPGESLGTQQASLSLGLGATSRGSNHPKLKRNHIPRFFHSPTSTIVSEGVDIPGIFLTATSWVLKSTVWSLLHRLKICVVIAGMEYQMDPDGKFARFDHKFHSFNWLAESKSREVLMVKSIS